MKQSQPFLTHPGQLVPLDAMLERLEPALKGYPVRALIDLWAGSREGEAPLATTLVDLCMSSWIVRLDADNPPAAPGPNEELGDLQARHLAARHALLLVRARFRRSAVVHRDRGQACG